MKNYILNRLREPSTWRGLILIATAAGATVTPQMAEAIVTAGIGLAGLVGVVTSDKKPESNG